MTQKIKKIIKASLSALFGAGLLAAIISSSIINSGTNTSDLFAEIVVSDNTSVLADKSFSETTFNGYRDFLNDRGNFELDKPVQDFREGFGLWRRPGSNATERETTFKGIFENGKDLIIAPGFNHQTAIENLVQDPAFSNKGFLLLDAATNAANVSSVVFRMEQAGFQSGVAASQFLNVNEEIFGKDGSLRIGGFVGLAFPSTIDFLIGFQKGMVAWNEANPSETQIEWITLGNNIQNYASGSFGIGDGRQISQTLITRGADVIMPIAGPQTLDSIAEIRLQNRPVVVIGVDSAQELNEGIQQPIPGLENNKIKNADGTNSDNNNIIQFSAEKKLDVAVQGTLTAISNPNKSNTGDFEGSQYGGFGYNNIIAIGPTGASAVGISNAGKDYFTKGLAKSADDTFESVVSDLKDNTIFQQMVGDDGTIDLIDSESGLNGSVVSGGNIGKYSAGLNNLLIDVSDNKLDGSDFAPPITKNNIQPIILEDMKSLRRRVD